MYTELTCIFTAKIEQHCIESSNWSQRSLLIKNDVSQSGESCRVISNKKCYSLYKSH